MIAKMRSSRAASGRTSIGGPHRSGKWALGTNTPTCSKHAWSVCSGKSNGWPVVLNKGDLPVWFEV